MSRNAPPRPRSRGVSTVLDAALFLLLVSAAIGVLYTVPQSDDGDATDPDVAAETATTLATSVETIEYVPAGADEDAEPRTDRGTLAELLAETTVANARLDDESLSRAPDHERAVRNVTRGTIRTLGRDVAIQVRTHWRPLPGSGVRGGIVVGPSPPPDADVHAATTAVPVGTAVSAGPGQPNWTAAGTVDFAGPDALGDHGLPAPRRAASLEPVADDAGCTGLALRIGGRIVGTLFPPERATLSLRAGGPPTELARTRYATAADSLDASGSMRAEMPPRRRNEFLATELAEPLATTCAGYDSPSAAARRAAPGTVLVSVRTWSR